MMFQELNFLSFILYTVFKADNFSFCIVVIWCCFMGARDSG